MARYSKINSFNALKTLTVGEKSYQIFNLPQAAQTLGNIDQLPKSLKVLLENLLRFEDQKSVKVEHIQALVDWQKTRSSDQEIQYRPARVLMQDFTGVPAVVDLAAMRAAMAQAGGDPNLINPLSPVDLVIETDCPDMTPLCCQTSTEHRTRNTPVNLPYILESLAQTLDQTEWALATQLWQNSLAALHLKF